MYKDVAGIYKITNILNGKVYIGSITRCKGRLSDHKRYLRLNIHQNAYLQNSCNKYGISNFDFQIIQVCLPKDFAKRELWWCDHFDSHNRLKGYNIKQIEGSHRLVSEETRLKLSAANLGKKMTKESKEKLRKINLGKKMPNFCMPKILASNRKKRKAIMQYDLTGKKLRRFVSVVDAFKSLGKKKTTIKSVYGSLVKKYNYGSLIRCLKKRSKTAYGFKWSYV